MQLCIMRHGEAEAEQRGIQDRERALTRVGAVGVQAAATMLQTDPPELIIASPYLRTQQTADIVATSLGMKDFATSAALRSEAPLEGTLKLLNGLDVNVVLLVSHMPLVSLLVEYTCGERVGFMPADVAQVDLYYIGREQGVLSWRHR